MSDALAGLYPSMVQNAPEVADLYPSMTQTAPEIAAPDLVQPPAPEPASLEVALYGETPPEVIQPVNWQEPAATHGFDFDLRAPEGVDASDAAHMELRQAFIEAGAGPTAGAEIYRHVAAAIFAPVTIQPADAMTQLRQVWGAQTDARIAMVQAAVAKMPAGARAALEATGAGNDPALIRKTYAAIAAKSKR